MSSSLNYLKIIGIILFIYILFKIDFAGFISAFRRINLTYYSISVLFLILSFLVRTFKWKRLVDSIGAKISSAALFKIMMKSAFLGVITPGKIGEFWRAQYLAGSCDVSSGKAFYTAFMDRLMDFLVLGLVAIPALLVIYQKFYVLIFMVLVFLSFVFLRKIGLQKIFKIFVKGKDSKFLTEFDSAFKGLRLKMFLEIFGYSLLYYLASVLIFYYTALALDIMVPFWYLFLVVAIVWIALTLPLTFLGLGIREAGFIYFFSSLGVPAWATVAFSLVALLSSVVILLPGAILFLRDK